MNAITAKTLFLALALSPIFYAPRRGIFDWSWLYAILIILLKFRYFLLLKFTLKEVVYAICCVISVVLTSVQVAFQGVESFNELYYLARAFRAVTVLIALKLVFHQFGARKNPEICLQALLTVGSLHFIAAILQRLPFLKLNKFGAAMNFQEVADSSIGWRSIGLSAGNDMAGVLVTVFAVLSLILLFIRKSSIRGSWRALPIVMLLLWGPLLIVTSRTGQVVAVSALCIMPFLLPKTFVAPILSRLGRLFGVATAAIVVTLTGMFYFGNQTVRYIAWVTTEPFRLMIAGRGLSTGSSDDMFQNHYKLPDLTWDLVFGDIGKTFKMPGVMISDVGYVQLLFTFGVVGLTAICGAMILLLFLSYKNLRRAADDFTIASNALIFLTTVVILVGNLKGPYIYSRQLFDFLAAILAMDFYLNPSKAGGAVEVV